MDTIHWPKMTDRSFYQAYLGCLVLMIGHMLFLAGEAYLLVTLSIGALLHTIQYDKERRQVTKWLKSLLIAGISVVFFITSFPRHILENSLWFLKGQRHMLILYTGFCLMATLMDVSVLSQKKMSHVKNVIVMVFVGILGASLYQVWMEPIRLLEVGSKASAMSLYAIQWGIPLLLMFMFNHLLGRKPEDLLGFKQLSVSEFIKYFILGMCLVCLSQIIGGYMAAMFFPSQMTLISYNLISWEACDYLFYQSIGVVLCLIQTLVEELAFRSILHAILDSCGYGKSTSDHKWEGYRIWELLVMTLIMGTWFSFIHLSNPIETGKAFGSIFEKFVAYFEAAGYALAFMLTGNVALSWGMHFLYNFKIGLWRFSNDATSNGFFKINVRADQLTSAQVMQQSLANMVLNVMLVIGAHYCIESSKGTSDSEGMAVKVLPI